MKIVIVGAGRVGYAIAEQLLTEGHDITVVESDPERAAYISSTLDVIVVEGRANVDQLRIANVADADLLIAATTSDETNLISCMVGRKLGATHTIARVRDEEYYQDVALLQDELGLSLSINPERTSAKEISRTLRFPAATKVEPFANGLVELVEFKLREGSKLDGLRLNDFRGRYSDGILICAVEREGSVTIPNGDFVLAAGDYVTVVGAPHELHELFRKIGEFRHEAESVIIIGGGRIAERLAYAHPLDDHRARPGPLPRHENAPAGGDHHLRRRYEAGRSARGGPDGGGRARHTHGVGRDEPHHLLVCPP